MAITGSDLLPLMSAALAAILVGSVWYSPWALGRVWMDATGSVKPTDQERAGLVLTPFNLFLAPINALLAAGALWILFGWLTVESLTSGVGIALVLWAGFSLTTTMWQAIYETRPIAVLMIDGGNQLVTYLTMAVILASWKAGYLPPGT